MAKKTGKQVRAKIEEANKIADFNIETLERELKGLNRVFDLRKRQVIQEELINEQRNKQINTSKVLEGFDKKKDNVSKRMLNILQKESIEQEKILNIQEKKLNNKKLLLDATKAIGNSIKTSAVAMKTFLMASDSAMKSLNLELGLSGERSAMMRENLENSAMFAARMGVDMKGLTQMVSTYADETGRVRQFNQENLDSMTLIAKGTALGIEGAARMAGQYEMMGFNATDTAGEVQRIVDTTERMGVNTGKVLKAVNTNFKKLQKYSFRNGVKSMADMAIYAEKFKIDMNSVFEPMEKGRRLDSVIEMSAQLQVLGGKFANLADPMSMLFESRNDPEAYMKRINEMTQGMVTLNKTTDGFDFALASPMAKDMLSQAAKALGMTTEELTKQAFRMREIQQTRSQMNSKGFTKDERDIIEGLAKFDKTTGRMFVEIGGVATDVSNIGSEQLAGLKEQSASLKQRAIDSQTFEDAFKNTILELKSTMLPLLKGINAVLGFVRPIVTDLFDMFKAGDNWTKAGMGVVAGLTLAAGVLAKAFVMGRFINPIMNSVAGGAAKNVAGGTAKNVAGGAARGAARGGGLSALGKGAGVGVAAVGVGTGVMLAAKGIAELATSMKGLEETQIWGLAAVMGAMAISAFALAPAIAAVGAAGTAGSLGLLAIGAAAVGVGFGINLAAKGISSIVEGLAMLDGVDLSGISAGMLSIGAAALMIGNPLGIIGMGAMTASVMAIGSSASDLERVGNAFYNIGAVMNGSTGQLNEIRDTIEAIASTDVSSNSGIGQLVNMLSKPLKVEFGQKEVALVANIDVNVGGSRFYTDIAKNVPAKLVDLQTGNNG